MAAVALVGAVGAGVVGARLWATSDEPPFTRAEVLAYQEAVHPLVTEWGRLEIQGMRPAIADLRTGGGVPAETIAGEAEHWQTALRELRRKLRAVPVPDSLDLRRAAALFDESIAAYIDAAGRFERAAATSEGVARDEGIEDGIMEARDGARRYNEASMALQAARRQVGLGVTPDFPNQPAEGDE